jgi:predicted RND superfamily exporter protein
MEDKKVILIRKQPSPFTVNYPFGDNGTIRTYTWQGTIGKVLNERPVPFDVFDWIQNYTTTLTCGALIMKETDDEDIKDIKENIQDIEKIEQSILTKDEIVEMLEKGNHLSLKKALKDLDEKTTESMKEIQKKYVIGIACDLGIDSTVKRQILVEWAKLDYKNSDLLFDKVLEEMYEKEAK